MSTLCHSKNYRFGEGVLIAGEVRTGTDQFSGSRPGFGEIFRIYHEVETLELLGLTAVRSIGN